MNGFMNFAESFGKIGRRQTAYFYKFDYDFFGNL